MVSINVDTYVEYLRYAPVISVVLNASYMAICVYLKDYKWAFYWFTVTLLSISIVILKG